MDENSTTSDAAPLCAGEAWFDPIEAGLRERVRGFIEGLIEQELTEARGRRRHAPGGGAGHRHGKRGRRRHERGGGAGHRHGKRERRLPGSFGTGGTDRAACPPYGRGRRYMRV